MTATTATVDSVKGFYTFTIKEPGTYAVSETVSLPWIQTAPTPGTYTFSAR